MYIHYFNTKTINESLTNARIRRTNKRNILQNMNRRLINNFATHNTSKLKIRSKFHIINVENNRIGIQRNTYIFHQIQN